jgi:hypothetical protein
MRASVYTAEYLESRVTYDGDRGLIRLDDGSYLSVITNIQDPLIANKGDGHFHPYPTELVIDLLREIDYPSLDSDVEVYALPFPRTNVLTSSASGSRVFLSPQVQDISRQAAAYVIAHEIGHVFQHDYLPVHHKRDWEEYRRLRGIEDPYKFSSRSSHAYRPTEIFAEDFRVLFGGPSAYFGGRVENPELDSPVGTDVEAFFLGLRMAKPEVPEIVALKSYPNPFNPSTEINVHLADEFLATGDPVAVRVYDIRGALVRELYDGRPSGADLSVRWDGLDANGRDAASATYFGVVTAGKAKVTHKLIVIK